MEEEKLFYFGIKNKIYKIEEKNAILVPFLNNIIEGKKYICNTPEKYLKFSEDFIINDNKKYIINNKTTFDFIIEYINIWKNDLSDEKQDDIIRVKYGDPNKYLNQNDIKLIENYIKKKNRKKYKKKVDYYKKCIDILSNLLFEISEHFLMKNLSIKIQIYIATIICKCSFSEIDDLLE